MTKKLFEQVFLIEITQPDIINLEIMYPSDHSLTDELRNISSASTPSVPLPKESFVYAFNMKNSYCFTLYFYQNNHAYEIIIISETPYANLFYTFLNQILIQFKDTDQSPNQRFQVVLSYIQKWDNQVTNGEITLAFPEGDTKFDLTKECCYNGFNPRRYFTKNQIKEIFNLLVTDQPVLIICDNAINSSYACLSLMSLLSPLRYMGKSILWLRETDLRFMNVVNGDETLKLVATPCQSIANFVYFQHVYNISDPKEDSTTKSVSDEYEQKVSDMLSVLIAEMDHLLNYNPWSDLLCDPFDSVSLSHLVKLLPRPSLTVEEYIKFSTSATFESFRVKLINRDTWREAILSSDIKIFRKFKNPDQLVKIVNYAKEQKKKYTHDEHVVSVLNTHIKIATQRYKELTGSDPC